MQSRGYRPPVDQKTVTVCSCCRRTHSETKDGRHTHCEDDESRIGQDEDRMPNI